MDIQSARWHTDRSGIERLRLLPGVGLTHFDPFTHLEHLRLPSRGTEAARPSRGEEMVSLILSGRIEVAHAPGVMQAGDVYRVTSGQGAILGAWTALDTPAEGLRLGIQLPRRLSRVDTGQQHVISAAFNERPIPGGHELIIAGPGSPLRLLTPLDCRIVRVCAGASVQPSLPPGWRLKMYLIAGLMEVEGHALRAGQALCVSNPQGLTARAITASRMFMAGSAPLNEPMGRFVPQVVNRPRRDESAGTGS